MLDLAAAMSYLLQGKRQSAKAVWTAWRDFIVWHKRLSAERKAIRSNVKREAPIYYGSVVLRYMFGKREFNDMM
jgi:hypothetical protein